MSVTNPFGSSSRRLAAYGYLAPLVEGRRVLEVGSGDGAGATHLYDIGAASVLGALADETAVARARREHAVEGVTFARLDPASLGRAGGFDLVVVPDAEALLAAGSRISAAILRDWLLPGGRLALLARSGDHSRGAGPGYYEMVEALEPLFATVRMFGLTPFAAFGLAEFSENPGALRIEGGLVDEAAEQPTHYLALAGPEDTAAVDLGYALVQVPAGPLGTNDGAAATRSLDDGGELRRRLAESEGKLEGLVRVSRAQTEEIEELRARLRRGAEARGELDEEVTRLRAALTEADRSVVDLTRRTTEEMAALAKRIAGGLAPSSQRPEAGSGRLGEELAARESALSERDDRIAILEAEKQDLLWRLEELEARAGEAVPYRSGVEADGGGDVGYLREELSLRDQALEQYRQAAIVHVTEVNRLREALGEQGTLVSELEEARTTDLRRQEALEKDNTQLRRQLSEAEEADRARRSRLAEVEGTLLRLQRQAALEAANGSGGFDEADRKVAALEAELGTERRRLAELQDKYTRAEQRAAAVERALEESRVALLAGQAAAAASPTTPPTVPAAAEGELESLREALERSEEQLWETKGQLLLDRERIAVLESHLAVQANEADNKTVSESVHLAIVQSVLLELGEIERALRAEIERIGELEQKVETWRADLAVTDTEIGVSVPRAE